PPSTRSPTSCSASCSRAGCSGAARRCSLPAIWRCRRSSWRCGAPSRAAATWSSWRWERRRCWRRCGRPSGAPRAAVVVLLGALATWTHPLGVVYALPAAGYVALRRREAIPPAAAAAVALAALAALALFARGYFDSRLPGAPGLLDVLRLAEGPQNLARLLRIGGAVLVGLAQGSTSQPLFDADWPRRPGSSYLVTLLLGLLVLHLLLRFARSLVDVARTRAGERESGPALL